VIEGGGIKRDLKLAGLGHETLLLQLTTIPRLPVITTLHWESCLSFSFKLPVLLIGPRFLVACPTNKDRAFGDVREFGYLVVSDGLSYVEKILSPVVPMNTADTRLNMTY